MKNFRRRRVWSRRSFLKFSAAGLTGLLVRPGGRGADAADLISNPLFGVDEIPDSPFAFAEAPNYHAGLEALLFLMGPNGLKFYRSPRVSLLSGPLGLISPNDVVLIKVNAQWKYRGCTNSDLIRGLVQRILDHPDGFQGEVVIFENGQGRGSLACDTSQSYGGDKSVQANANDPLHSFEYLADVLFGDPRVSTRLFDPVRRVFLEASDHATEGFRKFEDVSYPCFTTPGGRRVELREGIWNGTGYDRNLKLINVPVLKHHDQGGSEITASLKHFYGVVSMSDGSSPIRHYGQLGHTTGKMVSRVRTPVLNIIDAIWVSHRALKGYPAEMTFRANRLLASQDPVALDYWAAKNILYPIDGNDRHHPDFPGVDVWLTQARDFINGAGGLSRPEDGVYVGRVTKDEAEMRVTEDSTARFLSEGPLLPQTKPREPRRTPPGDKVPPRGNPAVIR
jgi:hypothetical protein